MNTTRLPQITDSPLVMTLPSSGSEARSFLARLGLGRGSPSRALPCLWAIFLAICVALPLRAEVNPYADIIATRNVFGLKDPPPPPPPPDTTLPAPKITLVGIANVMGVKKAVLKPQPAPGTPAKATTPGQPPPGQEPPLVLTEGAMQDGITVVSIDEASGIVQVDNNGQALTLSFDKDGMKIPSGPAAPVPGTPGASGLPGQPGIPRPPGMPGMVTAAGMNAPQFGGTPLARGVSGGVGSSPQGSLGVAGAGTVPSAIPERPLRTQDRPLSLEEQTILMEANRMATQEKVNRGLMPPLPPTVLTPPEERAKIVSPFPPGFDPAQLTK